jgi:putative transposase
MTMTNRQANVSEEDSGTRGFISGSEAVARLESEGKLDDLFAQIDAGQIQLDGPDGFIRQMLKATLERGLQAELSDHLGYEKGDPTASLVANSRNGSYPKPVQSEVGELSLDMPRDRASSFTPTLVPKGSNRLGEGLDAMIISLYAGGMTIRDIQHHLRSTIGVDLSHETVANITDAVLDEVKAWQDRPLEPIYPIMYLDALVIKIRDGHHVKNKSAHIAMGIDLEGTKHVLGIWIQDTEGAKFWAGVCANLKNRGVQDVLIVCCDGLTGFPEAIEATWPQATVQTCTVHLIRSSMRFVNYKDRRKVAAALKPIYTAPTTEAAETALLEFEDSELGKKYPATVATWTNAWERFTPFLAFPPEVRKIIYTTNAIESLNYQLRKIIKNRGHFPSDQAAIKLLWLTICNIEDKRKHERAKGRKQAGKRLIQGARTNGWKPALAALTLTYPDRINPHLK